MLSVRTLSLAVLLAAFGAHAQSTTATSDATGASGIPNISTCTITCLTQAGADNGGTFTDLSFACTNQAFQAAVATCLQSSCTAQDQQDALDLQSTQCAAYSATASGVASATSAAGSVSASASSVAASISSSAGSAASSISSAASSALSSAASHASSHLSSATSVASASATSTSNAGQKVPVLGAAVWGVALAAVGAVAGGAMMF